MTDPTPANDAADHDADFDDATSATLDTLEDVLDAVRARHPGTPQWEFCEGVLTALLCTRRTIGEDEWLPLVFGRAASEVFATPAERTQFSMGWLERESQLRAALNADVESLDDERALSPAVMDWRGCWPACPRPTAPRPPRARTACRLRWRRCGPAASWPWWTTGPTTGRPRATRKSPRCWTTRCPASRT